MLVLSRKSGESIRIGDDVTVILSSIDRRGVRLAIDAPRDVKILRAELAGQSPREPEGPTQ